MKRINLISDINKTALEKSNVRWNGVAKPLYSLGLLEEMVTQIAGITGSENILLDKRCVVDMCADNGVVCEGVTQTDSYVTAIVTKAMAEGTSNINRMAITCGADVIAVDIGINRDIKAENLICRKIAYGTENIAVGAAMTLKQAERAISVGIDIAGELKEKNYKIIVTGEMGIGNTTTSSAIASILLGLPPEDVTGRGAGLDSTGLKRKIDVIKRAISVNKPSSERPLELISKLGGYDIAGMTGLFIGGAVYRIPVVIDGFISAVSAALAIKICPLVRNYILCSHVSKEPAGMKILKYLGMKPLITAQMCLGEGTGGVLLLPMLDAILSIYNGAHRFDELPMERYKEL